MLLILKSCEFRFKKVIWKYRTVSANCYSCKWGSDGSLIDNSNIGNFLGECGDTSVSVVVFFIEWVFVSLIIHSITQCRIHSLFYMLIGIVQKCGYLFIKVVTQVCQYPKSCWWPAKWYVRLFEIYPGLRVLLCFCSNCGFAFVHVPTNRFPGK